MIETDFVTGAAGFIGSNLVDRLLSLGHHVVGYDNFSTGQERFLEAALRHPCFQLVRGDLLDFDSLAQAIHGCGMVFHLAANADVRFGTEHPRTDLEQNTIATFNLLESMRESGTRIIVFASTSTIYGEASTQPTPENYGPLLPISTYGASKLACEAMIASYAYTYGLRGLILRLGNVVGSRSNHGVVPDFLKKLKQKPDSLEVLGDGTQSKSYIHISDCISAIEIVVRNFTKSDTRVDAYNVSSADRVSVRRIAEIVLEEAGANGQIKTTGGVDGGRGWMGDVKVMQLSNQKLQALGWKDQYNSEMAIKQAARELITQI